MYNSQKQSEDNDFFQMVDQINLTINTVCSSENCFPFEINQNTG